MLLSSLLYFNVFFLLVHSFSQDKEDVLKKLEATLLSMEKSIFKVQQNIQNTDHEVKNSTKRINKVLAPHGRTIDEYVKCKTNEFKAEEGLSTNTTMALEHTWKKCDELADQFPEDRLFAILDIYMKVHEFDETHEEHKQ
ncbi:hypothetical protein KSF78_0008463 [Schistosoma japonicum]|nr:hypothetical protein KSF78_0008463 [Schistosoma japonicum]